MRENKRVGFDPIALRSWLAEHSEGYAAFLANPLFADEAAARMPGFAEWHAYRALPPVARRPRGLNAGDFASAYRTIPHPAGILEKKRSDGYRLGDR
jgi:hypothetical protein